MGYALWFNILPRPQSMTAAYAEREGIRPAPEKTGVYGQVWVVYALMNQWDSSGSTRQSSPLPPVQKVASHADLSHEP